jgi:hypothetical protein
MEATPGDHGAYRSDQAFYCALALATLILTIINFMPVDPVKAL